MYYSSIFWALPKMKRFTRGVLQKSILGNVNRVFPSFYARQNVPLSLGGAHFFSRPRAISTSCSSESCFFEGAF